MEENELLQNELLAGDLPEAGEEPTYNIIYSPGTSTGLFDPRTGTEDRTGEAEYNGEMRVEQLTESEIKERWDADTFLQDQFGDFENYMGYVAESSDTFAETNWWESKGIDNRTEAEKIREGDDLGRGDSQVDTAYDQKQTDDSARKSGYQKWLMSDENKALMEKYGVSDTVMNDKGDKYIWMGNGYTLVDEAEEMEFSDWAKTGIMVATSVAMGNAAGALSGLAGAAGGAVSGAVGSTIQGVLSGDLSAEGIIKGAITGAIGGWADQLKGMDGAIMDSSVLGGMDDAVNATADLLGIPYDEALGLLQGVAQGAVNGEDLDGMILGAVSGWGASKTKDFLQGMYGDEINVDDWFKDGQSNIPIEALDPFIEGAFNAAINGGADGGDLAKMLWEYHQAGGDLDFLLPPGVDLSGGSTVLDWIDSKLPDVTIDWGAPEFDIEYEEGLGPEDGFEEDEKDKITVGIPGVDLPDLPDLPDVSVDKGEDWTYTENDDGSIDITWDEDIIPDISLPDDPFDFPMPDLPDINLPEIDIDLPQGEGIDGPGLPEVDVDLPDIDLPSVPDVDFTASDFKHDPQGLFDYINIKPQEAAQLTPYVDYIQKARGMLS